MAEQPHRRLTAYWYKKEPNFGDALTPYLFPKFGLDVEWAPAREADCIGVGSILEPLLAGTNTIILGSGFIRANMSFDMPRHQVAAVRGLLTAQRLGLAREPIPFGDPGILIEADPAIQARYKIGIVPHYVDKQSGPVQEIKDRLGDDVFVIDVEHNDVEAFIADVARCDMILSSSLHGLITGWALGKPAGWLELSKRVVGNGFKFQDFYSAFGVDHAPSTLTGIERLADLEAMCHAPPITVPTVRNNLLEAFDYARRRLLAD